MKKLNLSKRTKFWIISGGIIGLMVAAIFVIYFWQPSFVPENVRKIVKKTIDEKVLGKETVSQASPQEKKALSYLLQTITQGAPASTDLFTQPAPETATWPTYKNEQYGYEVKYPEDLKPQEIQTTTRTVFSERPLTEDSDQMAPIELIILEKTSDQEVDDIKGMVIKDYKEEEIMIDGISAKKISGTFGLFFWGIAKHTYLLYEKNGKLYEWSAYSEDKDIANKFELMVSTLKFTK